MRSDLNNQSDQNHTGARAHVKLSFRDEGRRRRRRDGRERGDVEKLGRGGEACRGQYAKFELPATFERWKLGVTFLRETIFHILLLSSSSVAFPASAPANLRKGVFM